METLPLDVCFDEAESKHARHERNLDAHANKRPRKPQNVRSLNSELLQGADYVIDHEKGLRRVKPYLWSFKTHCKGRWIGMTIEQLFTTEFRDRGPDHYRRAIAAGKVHINGKAVSGDYVLRDGDVLNHASHRHEPPVTSQSPEIVFMDDDLIVVNKPAGMPVHPTGRYRHNSVLNVLSIERDVSPRIAPCNRLDRLTSGLMFFSQNPAMADKMRKYLFDREVSKQYVARVEGEFPESEAEILVDQPIKSINPLYGLNRVTPDGKPSQTTFKRLSYNGATSVVLCSPKTGRTHQIRVHLQWLGHPIANDPIYANRNVWGDDPCLSQSLPDADVELRLSDQNRTDLPRYAAFSPTRRADGSVYTPETVAEAASRRARRQGELLTGENCPECEAPLFTDPTPDELCIFLHAWKYRALDGTWGYETKLPDWADEHWRAAE